MPAKSVRNIRFPLKSRAIPIPSSRCVSKMSGCRMFAEIGINRRAVNCVPARRISAVGPIKEPILQIELEIDRFRQTIE